MRRRRRNKSKRIVLILVVLSSVVFLGITYKVVNDKRQLSIIENLVKDTGLFINKIANAPVKYINDKVTAMKEKNDLYEKYKELESKQEKYNTLQAKKDELEYQLKKMQKVLDLNNVISSDSYLNATVINRNIGIWYNVVTIDKGSKNGVKEDMPVIVNEGLIGKVIKVSNFSSTVKLLTSEDINNKISVKIKNDDDFIMGLLTNYKISKNVFIVEGIDKNVDIKVGSLVTTTGLSDYFPSGIVIGKVKAVKTDNFDLAKIIEVETDVDFNQINYVTILKRDGVE